MHIKVEEAITITCPVTIVKEGTERDGFFVYDMTSDTKSIEITGPKNILDTIESAHAIVNVDDVYSSTNKKTDLTIYDKNGNIVNLKNCKLNKEEVLISLKTYKTKSIPFKISIKESDTMSADIIEENLSFDHVIIATSIENFNNINELNIDLDINKYEIKDSKIDTTIDLNDFTPENVYIVEDSNLEILLALKLYKIEDFVIKNSDIKIEGDTEYKILDENITVKVKYDLDSISEMKVSFLEPTINTSNIVDDNVNVSFKEDPAFVILNTPVVTVQKEEK
jgi:YbbR domain-containing protein